MSEAVRVTFRKGRAPVARYSDDAEDHFVRHQRREQHRPRERLNDAQQRGARRKLRDRRTRPRLASRPRTGERGAGRAMPGRPIAATAPAFPPPQSATPTAAFSAPRVAENCATSSVVLEAICRANICNASLSSRVHAGSSSPPVGVAAEARSGSLQVAEDDASRDAVAARCDHASSSGLAGTIAGASSGLPSARVSAGRSQPR